MRTSRKSSAPANYHLPVRLHQQNNFCWYRDGVQSVAEIPFIAGHVALDFVNTAEGRGHPDAGEALRTPGDLRLWGERRGVIAPVAPVPDDADVAHVADADAGLREFPAALQARELLYRLFLGQARGDRAAA